MSSSGLDGCCPWRVGKRLLGLVLTTTKSLTAWWHYGMMTFCIVGKTCQSDVSPAPISCDPCANQLWFLRQSVVILAIIGYDPCANQLRALRYRPMESSLRPALTTTTRDKQPSASMISNHRQGLHFCGQTLPSGSCCHSRRVKWGKINSLAIRRLRFVNHYELVWLKTILYFCNIITYRILNGDIRCDQQVLLPIAYE